MYLEIYPAFQNIGCRLLKNRIDKQGVSFEIRIMFENFPSLKKNKKELCLKIFA